MRRNEEDAMGKRVAVVQAAPGSVNGATVLVDTSLLIEQQKRRQLAQPVQDALSHYRFKGASSYSKLEFKRAWVQRLAYIHGISRRPGVASVADVFGAINKLLSNSWQRRRVQTCVEVILGFFESSGESLSGYAQLALLRAHCKAAALTSFGTLCSTVTGEFKGTGCVRAEQPPRENVDGTLDVTIRRCSRNEIHCTVHKFFESNQAFFLSVADYADQVEDASSELRNMSNHIRKAKVDSTHLCDDKHCSKLADALIAVDGKDMDVFAANNDKEWKPLASLMDKPLLNPVTAKPRDL